MRNWRLRGREADVAADVPVERASMSAKLEQRCFPESPRIARWRGTGIGRLGSSDWWTRQGLVLRRVIDRAAVSSGYSLMNHQPARRRILKGSAMSEIRKLYRSRSNRMLAGVCGGLAQYFNTDPTLVRVLFVVLAVLGGSGLLIYLVLWVVVPEEPQGGA
jgi:phage shock protein C